MSTLLPSSAIACLVLTLAGVGLAEAQTTAKLSGRWIGVLDTVRPDGSIAPDSALFQLQQEGNKLTGSAGNDDRKLSPIASGQIQGQSIDFDVAANPSMTVHFHLRAEGEHLRGEATGLRGDAGTKFVVDVTRWPDGAPPPAIVHTPSSLLREIAALDAKLFDAYNHCDLATLGGLVSDDLEFYHDKTGLAVGKKPFIESIQQNICGKVQRSLNADSLEVYPLAHFGAVEIGTHRFSHPGHPEDGSGEAKFVMLWKNTDGVWIVTRVISYDHGSNPR